MGKLIPCKYNGYSILKKKIHKKDSQKLEKETFTHNTQEFGEERSETGNKSKVRWRDGMTTVVARHIEFGLKREKERLTGLGNVA